MRMGRCCLSVLLVFSLVVSNSSMVEAKKISKEETVYVNASAEGKADTITVSDWLKGVGQTTGNLSDKSELSDITNVKGDETFEQNGNSLTWTAQGKDIYYQGTSSKELPVDMSIAYTLDGKSIKAEELSGKSGKVEIKISYKNKCKQKKNIQGKEETIYAPFVMVTGMILSGDTFQNITIDNGKVINDGSNNIVVGMGLPGMAESLGIDDENADRIPSGFTVTADVKDFTMGNTFTVGSAGLLNELDLDDVETLDELEEKLEDLTEASETLLDGTEELSDNMKIFDGKMGELKKSMNTFRKSGVNQLTKGIHDLAKGAPALVKGVKEYTGGVTEFAQGTTDYVDGAKQITDGCSELYGAVKGMPLQIKTFNSGLQKYTGAVDKLGEKNNVEKLKTGAKSVSSGVSSLNAELTKLEETYKLAEGAVSKLENAEQIKAILAQQKAAVQALKQATSQDSALQQGASQVSSGVNTVMDSLSQLSTQSSTLRNASSQLNTKVPKLVTSADKLKKGGDKLAKNNEKLKKSSKKLVKASKQLNTSVKKVNRGVKKLDKGGTSLKKATKKLDSGVSKLENASGKLQKGSKKLAEGMSRFDKEGIEKLNTAYEDDFQTLYERVKALRDTGKNYNSFSGSQTNMDGNVKFIIETESIEKKEK